MKGNLWKSSRLLALATVSSQSLGWRPPRSVVTSPLVSPRPQARRNFPPTLAVRSFSVCTFSSLTSHNPPFRPGDRVQVEVVSFGPLGASVGVIGLGHGGDSVIQSADEEPYATGLVLQQEIAYFRRARRNLDVVKGEVLPAYVHNVRDDGKLDICLRSYGGKAKAKEIGELILNELRSSEDGILPIGDKSHPDDINAYFPGISKTSFKKAVGLLYKRGLIRPDAKRIKVVPSTD